MWVCIAFFLLAPTALAADVSATSGTCGDSATWSYDQTTKTLTISGSGVIEDVSTHVWQWKDEITNVAFNGSFTQIGHHAFRSLSKLTKISIPDGVTRIGDSAFPTCLAHMVIPNSVSSIDWYGGSYSLLTTAGPIGSSCAIEYGWTDAIPVGAFAECSSLTQFTFPDNVKVIGDHAFVNTGLTQVTILNTVTEIGEGAFAGTGLTELTIPATVTKLGYNVFGRCQGLSHVVIQANASAISPNRPLYEGQYHNPTTNKTEAACPLLTSVGPLGSGSNIEIGWDTIPAYAFAGCNGLKTITLPDTVKTIGENAFNTCTGLTTLTIPNSVTTIGNRAISYCPNLKALNIPASVIRINNGHDGVFGGCTSLETITVDPGNTVYSAQDGALFSKEKATLYCVPQGKSSFTIPAGVTTIENYAFSSCTKLTDISIPSGVTEIGSNAFTGCSGLTKLVIPNGVTSSYFIFYNCTALTEVTLPGTAYHYGSISGPSLTTVRISEGAKELSGTFSGVTTLTDVYLPASLTRIGQNSFANCSNLKNIYFAGTQAQWDALTIADGNQELSLATVVCTGTGETPPVNPDNPDTPTPPETLGVTTAPGGLGQHLTVQVQAGHWLTIQTRRAGSIAISSIQAPVGVSGVVTVTFSAPSGSIVQVWETENELTFVNGVPTNKILKTVVKEL